MSESTDAVEDLAAPAPRYGGRNDALLLAVGETRAAAKAAAEASTRVEAAVGGLSTRVGALEVDVAALKARLGEQAEDRRMATSGWTVAAVVIAAIAAFASVIAIVVMAYQ